MTTQVDPFFIALVVILNFTCLLMFLKRKFNKDIGEDQNENSLFLFLATLSLVIDFFLFLFLIVSNI